MNCLVEVMGMWRTKVVWIFFYFFCAVMSITIDPLPLANKIQSLIEKVLMRGKMQVILSHTYNQR